MNCILLGSGKYKYIINEGTAVVNVKLMVFKCRLWCRLLLCPRNTLKLLDLEIWTELVKYQINHRILILTISSDTEGGKLVVYLPRTQFCHLRAAAVVYSSTWIFTAQARFPSLIVTIHYPCNCWGLGFAMFLNESSREGKGSLSRSLAAPAGCTVATSCTHVSMFKLLLSMLIRVVGRSCVGSNLRSLHCQWSRLWYISISSGSTNCQCPSSDIPCGQPRIRCKIRWFSPSSGVRALIPSRECLLECLH